MSNTPDDDHKTDKPLPRPIGEDGIIHETDRDSEDEDLGGLDGGLTDIGSGKPNERKIV